MSADAVRARSSRRGSLVGVRTRAECAEAGLSDQAEIGKVIAGAVRAPFAEAGCIGPKDSSTGHFTIHGMPGWSPARAAAIAGGARGRNEAEELEASLDNRRHDVAAFAGPGAGQSRVLD